MKDIIASIDAATGCQQCTKPLGESPSGDFCCEGCQEDWHGERAIALPAEPRRPGIDGYFDDLLRVYGMRMYAYDMVYLPFYDVTWTREGALNVALVAGIPGGATDTERAGDLPGAVRDLIATLTGMDPDDFVIRWTRSVTLPNGQVLRQVHSPEVCAGRACCIHNPSGHHMAGWPMGWRDDRGLMERTCTHGIGHPDPDHMAWVLQRPGWVGERESGVHSCDGCCVQGEFVGQIG